MVDHINDIVELNQHCNFFLCGDFNFPSVNWKIPCALGNNGNENKFVECIINNGLTQIVDFPTRKDNILDLIFCNDANYISRAYCVEPFVLSDHENIFFTIDLAATNVTLSPDYLSTIDEFSCNYNFKNADYISLSNYLCSVNWYLMFSQCNTNDAWCLFKKCLWYAISHFVPIKKPSNSKKRTHKDTTPQYLRKLSYKKKCGNL